MKFKKFFPVLICAALIVGAGGVVLANKVGKEGKVDKVTALTDLGEFTFDGANDDSAVNYMYGINWTTNEAPAGWDSEAFAPVGEDSGTFMDGVRVGTEIKKIGPNTYYIPVTGAVVDSVVTVKGSWANSTYQFTVNELVRKWDGTRWVYALEDYDVVSLKDANMPDFVNQAINTEDAAGYGYIGYDESEYAKKFMGKQKGVFGLTNNTDSYAFQFNFKIDEDEHGDPGKLASWVTIRLGATGGWDSGDLIRFQFTNIWHDDGCAQVNRFENGTMIDAANAHEFRTDISHGERLLEMGAVKVKGYTNKYYVYFKNNGSVDFGEYWDLTGIRSTKVGIYAADTNFKFTNSVEPVATKLTLSEASAASALQFNTPTDVLPFISTWALWFTPVEQYSVSYNGEDKATNTWNFFKKVGATTNALYLNLGDLGITPADGDVLHLGGTFKMTTYVDNNITMVYKLVIEECDFQFNGTAWREIDVGYAAADFAKDLLKQTLTICTGADGNNGEALAAVWATLSSSNYYGKLSNSERDTLASAVGDSTIVVPTTSGEVDAMSDADALAAAIYRYDFCTNKYSLTEFINGRTISLPSRGITIFNNQTNINVIILITSSIALVCASLFTVLYFISRKRKQER